MEKRYFEIRHKKDQQLTEEDVRRALAIYYTLDDFEVKDVSDSFFDPEGENDMNNKKNVIADGTQGMKRGE